jgi:phosphate acetyltransferase
MPVDLFRTIKDHVRQDRKRILLAETHDPRVVKAAARIQKEDFCQVVLLGRPDELKRRIAEEGGDADALEVIDSGDQDRLAAFADVYYDLRKHKGIHADQARQIVTDPLFMGALCVREGLVDGMVAGSASPTPHVIRAALHCVGTRADCKTLSSCFVMVLPTDDFGLGGILVFADCGVVPMPTKYQLVDITRSAAASWRQFTQTEPVVALLSFSTKGSSDSEEAAKMAEVARRASEIDPHLVIDGELQVDAALVPEVARTKCPDSPVRGRANVLIFPDLQAGNIGYKLVQRLAHTEAVGPILQGLAKPVNDLSRGCNVEDVVSAAAITAAQAIG